MKIAILSDIHSNLVALEAVLRDIRSKKVDQIFCLGDTVGYGAKPRECLEIIADQAEVVIKGNHEDGVCRLDQEKARVYDQVNPEAFEGLVYARSQMEQKHLKYMQELPETQELLELGISLAHGVFSDKHLWGYIKEKWRMKRELELVKTQFCFLGHTHRPFVYSAREGLYSKTPYLLDLNEAQYLINVGSVGQPRDWDMRASYMILEFDSAQPRLEFRRVFYDIKAAQEQILRAGLPEDNAKRLLLGE